MSRSRKKPIVKDGRKSTSKGPRRFGHRRMRQVSKQMLAAGEFDLLPVDEAEFICDWNICDYRYDMRWDREEAAWPDYAAKAATK